jgi:hypothetical protein
VGVDVTVKLGPAGAPSWSVVTARLASRGISVPLRMIDDQLAFPDESPPDDWRELRVASPTGMITIRRTAETITLVTWANIDDATRATRDSLAWALGDDPAR